MKRIQIPTYMLRNPVISHQAIYLYIILKTMTNSLKVIVYTQTILEHTHWNDRRTLKKYLYELKKLEFITYNFTDLPINKPLFIEIIPLTKGDQFTQVDIDTIQKVINICLAALENQNQQNKNNNLKEMAIRLFYLYESYYNPNYNIAFPSYRAINSDTGISNTYIKTLNKLFNDNELVIVNYGEKVDWNKKSNNTYIPICNRPESKKEIES